MNQILLSKKCIPLSLTLYVYAKLFQEVPHHLIDILHPSQGSSSLLSILSDTHVCNNQKLHMFNDLSLDYSVGEFFEDGRQATKDILSRGRVPIVTGGTGLYLRWYVLCPFLYMLKANLVSSLSCSLSVMC